MKLYCNFTHSCTCLALFAILVGIDCLGDGVATAAVFPVDSEWEPIASSLVPVADVVGDGQSGGRDLVGDTDSPAAFLATDAEHLFLRLRLDTSPAQGPGLGPYSWSVLIDSDMNDLNYEFALSACGITDALEIWQNTTPSNSGSPDDTSELLLASQDWLAGSSGRVVLAESSFSGDSDFYLDWAVSLAELVSAGIAEGALVRLWIGTSNVCDALTVDLADHTGTPGAGDLTGSVSDPVVLIPVVTAVEDGGQAQNPVLSVRLLGPNPSGGYLSFRITLLKPGKLQVALLDLRGRRRWTRATVQMAGDRIYTVPVADVAGTPLPNGTYVFMARAHDATATTKIMLLQ